MRNYEEALQDYDLALRPKNSPLLNLPSNIGISFNPILSMIHINRGNIKAELNDYEGALADYDEALQPGLLPQHPAVFFNRANINVILRRFENAIEDYNEAIQLGAPNAYFNKGNTLVILGRFDEALQSYDEGIKEENDRTGAVNNRNKVAEILSMINGAEQSTRHNHTEPLLW